MNVSPQFHNSDIDQLLKSDYTVEEVGSQNPPGANSEVLETGDRNIDPELAETALYILNKFRDVIDIPLDWPKWRDMIANAITDYTKNLTIDATAGENPPDANSKVLETGDRIFGQDIERINHLMRLIEACSPPLGVEISTDEWHSRLSVAIVGWMREQTIDDTSDEIEAHRETVKLIRKEHARQLNEVGQLVTALYLDFQYVKRITHFLTQSADTISPVSIRVIAQMIETQSAGSLQRIVDHQQTAHYPQSIIHRHERTATDSDRS